MSFERLSRRMRVRAENFSDESNRIMVQAGLVADQVLVLSTPVDTGRARSNWLVSLNAPQGSLIAPYAPGEHLGRGERANAAGALDQGKTALAARRPGQDIYITNSVPYITRLNEGSSAQAPAMFVESAVQSAVFFAAQTLLNTGKGL